MTVQEIADKYEVLMNQGKFDQIIEEMYGDNCVSIEPAGGPWPELTSGLDAIKAKGEQFNSMVEEVHGISISKPEVCNNYFTCRMDMDATFKGAPRNKSSEICVFEVDDAGKIVKEQFFYPVNPNDPQV